MGKLLVQKLLKWGNRKLTCKKLLEDITINKRLMKALTNDSAGQQELLHTICLLISRNRKNLLHFSAHIMKKLYDEDVVEEEVILDWSRKMMTKYVDRQMLLRIVEVCKPFLEWLDDSESESEEEVETAGWKFSRQDSTTEVSSEVDIDAI